MPTILDNTSLEKEFGKVGCNFDPLMMTARRILRFTGERIGCHVPSFTTPSPRDGGEGSTHLLCSGFAAWTEGEEAYLKHHLHSKPDM